MLTYEELCSYYAFMNTTTHLTIDRLVKAFGSYTAVARHIGMKPRSFRKGRNAAMSMQTRYLIRHASHALYLRMLLKELRTSGAVSLADIREASKKVNDTFFPS